jgi:hypothetical protein
MAWLTLTLLAGILVAVGVCARWLFPLWGVTWQHETIWGDTPASLAYLTFLLPPAIILWYGLWRDHPRVLHTTLASGLVALVVLATRCWVAMPGGVRADLSHLTVPIVVSMATAPAPDCARGVYPTLTLTNISRLVGSSISWTASTSADYHLQVNPSDDAVSNTQPETVTLSGARPPTSLVQRIVVTFVEPYLAPGPAPSQTVTLRC